MRRTSRPRAGTYLLLACADDTKVVAETNDTNKCRASATAVVVAL